MMETEKKFKCWNLKASPLVYASWLEGNTIERQEDNFEICIEVTIFEKFLSF